MTLDGARRPVRSACGWTRKGTPSWCVSEMAFPPGWTATVDGRPVPIHRVDHVLMGVEVPAGSHEVALRHDGTRRGCGARGSAARGRPHPGPGRAPRSLVGRISRRRRASPAQSAEPPVRRGEVRRQPPEDLFHRERRFLGAGASRPLSARVPRHEVRVQVPLHAGAARRGPG